MAATTGPNLGIKSGWAAAEDGWDTDMNANLRRADTLTMGSVLDKDLATPPGSPANGDRYIVPTGATGVWAGKAGYIACWTTQITVPAWDFYAPKRGWTVFVEDEHGTYQYDSAGTVATGWHRITNWVNAIHFASIQAAIDSLPSGGGTVFIPAGTYDTTTTPSFTPGLIVGTKLKPGITLLGEGRSVTRLVSASTSADMVYVRGDECRLEKLALIGPNASGAGRCVVVGRCATEDSTTPLRAFSMVDVYIYEPAADGLWFRGYESAVEGDDPHYPGHTAEVAANCPPILCDIDRCVITWNRLAGSSLVRINAGNVISFRNVHIGASKGYMARVKAGVLVTFSRCTFDTKEDDLQEMVLFHTSTNSGLDCCYMEVAETDSLIYMVKFYGCSGCYVRGTYMARSDSRKAKAIWLNDQNVGMVLEGVHISMGSCSAPGNGPNGTDDIWIDDTDSSYVIRGLTCSDASQQRPVTVTDAGTRKSSWQGLMGGATPDYVEPVMRFKVPEVTAYERATYLTPAERGELMVDGNGMLTYYDGANWYLLDRSSP